MAAGEPKFSHITVTPDDEDDVVIQAGARPARAAAPAAEEAFAPAARTVDDEAVEQAVEDAAAPEPADEDSAEDAGFQETTLDDLESAPMPVAQKIVIALGVVGVIAVVAWYLFLR
ncbi:SURF2 Surfeit locus protein 2 [Eggerthella timonensis]|uniref:SURF2 Surfeit locus protein 2 n=1 Tax=Eggerthella timonensis TaxID=1871008 RepID=UPI000C771E0F|nr:SURF2 Surfeit locus protein 2 [Eggerthella timonensis]